MSRTAAKRSLVIKADFTGDSVADDFVFYQAEALELVFLPYSEFANRVQMPEDGHCKMEAWLASNPALLYIDKVGTVNTDSNRATVTLARAETAFTPGNYLYTVKVFDADETLMGVVSSGEFTVKYAPDATEVNYIGPFANLDYSNVQLFENTATHGPYRAGDNVTFTANGDGSVDINAPAAPAVPVQSVDGRTGDVTLDDLYLGKTATAADVDPEGTAIGEALAGLVKLQPAPNTSQTIGAASGFTSIRVEGVTGGFHAVGSNETGEALYAIRAGGSAIWQWGRLTNTQAANAGIPNGALVMRKVPEVDIAWWIDPSTKEVVIPHGVRARPRLVSANATAALDDNIHVTATATITDPTGASGRGYRVTVIAGTATVGGTPYAVAGTVIVRVFSGSAWASRVFLPESSLLKIANNLSDVENAATARTNLGLAIGTDVQGQNATLQALADAADDAARRAAVGGAASTDPATETTPGLIKKATAAQVIEGTVDDAAVPVNGLATLIAKTNPYHRAALPSRTGANEITIAETYVTINGAYYRTPGVVLDLDASASWDTTTPSDYTVAATRAGVDFSIYAVIPTSGSVPDIVLSANTSGPTGAAEGTFTRIGGFHCLCVSVGTISGHALTGMLAGDVLPASIWDLRHRSLGDQDGTVWDAQARVWVDIYLASWDGTRLRSAFGAAIQRGSGTPAFHWYNFAENFMMLGKRLPRQNEFMSFSDGSNQMTNITGSTLRAAGGWTDTAGRRMISHIGVEECCGHVWQWGIECAGQGRGNSWVAENWIGTANTLDDVQTLGLGSSNGAPNRPLFGGRWIHGSFCGSRCAFWGFSPIDPVSSSGARGVAEPANPMEIY